MVENNEENKDKRSFFPGQLDCVDRPPRSGGGVAEGRRDGSPSVTCGVGVPR